MPNDRDGVIAAHAIQEFLPNAVFILWSADDPKNWPQDFPGKIIDKMDIAGIRAAIADVIHS